MTTRASAKASARRWENRVAEYLHSVFPHVERRRLHGRFDKGDLINTGDWTLECKNEKVIRWSDALAQAEAESRHAKTRWHAAVINRRNHPVEQAYALMTLAQLRDLIEHMNGGTDGRGNNR